MKVLQTTSTASLTAANQGMPTCATRPNLMQTAGLVLLALAIFLSARPVAADFLGNEQVIRSALEKSHYAAEETPLLGWFDFKFSERKIRLEDIRIQVYSPALDPTANGQLSVGETNASYSKKNDAHVTIGLVYFFLNTNRSIDDLSVTENNGSLTVSYNDKNIAGEQRNSKGKAIATKKDTVYPIFAFSLKF